MEQNKELNIKIEKIYIELLNTILKESNYNLANEHYILDKLNFYLKKYNENHFNI